MQQAAEKAKSDNEALAAKNAALAAQLAKRISASVAALNTKTEEAIRAIETTPIADCRLPPGVLESVNAVRSGAAAEIDRAYSFAGKVRKPAPD